MRTTLGTLFLTLCLALAGCQTAGKSGKTTSRPGGGAPDFVGVPEAPKEGGGEGGGSPATTASAPKERKGTLAGSVQDSYNRLKPGAIIQLIEIGAKDKKAPFQVMANKAGCFEVQNLAYGKRYELRAEVKVGNRLLTGSTTAVVPSPRVAIYLLQEEPVSGSGEASDPAPPPSSPPASGDDPQVTIGRPVPNGDGDKAERREGEGPGPGASTPSSISPPLGATDIPPKVTTGDPSLLAEIKPKGKAGDLPNAPPPPVANVPGRPHTPEKRDPPGGGAEAFPLPPRSTGDLQPSGAPSANPASPPVPSAGPGAEARGPEATPPARLVVPSCVRVGNTVQSFALYDKDGVAREYRAPFKNKLILLDFWFGDCRPCRDVIPKLNQWHKKYKGHPIEIVGVNCEPYTTTLAEKKDALRKAMAKHNIRIDYTELISGGGKGDCPLVKQMLDGEGFPTLILLDQDGKVLYRVSGSNPSALNRLDWVIYNHLFPGRATASANR